MASGPARLLYLVIPYLLSRKDWGIDFKAIGTRGKKPKANEKKFDMSKFQMAILFPTSLQWFWLMNNLSTKILNALYVKVAGPLDVKEEEED